MSGETLPEYLSVSEQERGDSLGIDFEAHRALARSALRVIAGRDAMMGIYRLADSKGCSLEFWFASAEYCLTIVVNSVENQLSLLSSPMDSGGGVFCLMTVDNSENGWRKLWRLAREEISA